MEDVLVAHPDVNVVTESDVCVLERLKRLQKQEKQRTS
jgi:hypothetical protein